MGEAKNENRTIRISNRVIVAIAVLLLAILAAAVYIIPDYGKVFAAYRGQHKEYRAAKAALSDAEEKNAELTEKRDSLVQITSEAEQARSDAFAAAAKLEQDILDGKTDKKICYITLDDGPYKRGGQFLELFNKYDIKATFFLTTANGNKLPDQADITAESQYPEYIRDGHTIGNHTYSHDYGTIYSSASVFMKSVNSQQKFTEKATGGYVPEIVRMPGGSSTAGVTLPAIRKALAKEGLGWVDWTVDSGDSWGADRATPELITKNVKEAAGKQKIMVILFHEWSKASYEAMPEIIEYLDKEGFIFLPLFKDSVMVNKE